MAINHDIELEQCQHPTLIMELAYGGPTGHFICMQCERLLSAAIKDQAHVKQNSPHRIADNPKNAQAVTV